MTDYRTQEQYEDIIEDMYNGNWTDAARRYNEAAFEVKSFIDMDEEERTIDSLENLCYLVELAGELND